MKHLTDEQLSARLDGALAGRAADEVERHLAACELCREALAELAAGDESLKTALAHDPGEAYFESFASRVEARIGAAGAAPKRFGGGFDPGRFFRAPKSLAWAGGIAVLVVGGGLALMTGREVLPPDLRDRDVAARVERAMPREGGPVRPGAPVQVPPPVEMRSREESQTPGASMEEEQVAPQAEKDDRFAPPPGDVKALADALMPGPPTSPPATSAPAAARTASPGRAMEMRRNEAGEEVPVRRQGERRTAPAPSPAVVGGTDQAAQVRKKLLAEPLDAAKQSAPVRGAEGEDWLCGDVRDAADRPIAGAHVVLTDLGRTATTDALGRFCMRVPNGEHPLSVMAVGYTVSRQSVRAEGAGTNVRVTLAAVSVLEGLRTTIAGRAAPRRVPVAPPSAPLGDPRDSYSTLSDTLRRMVREAQRLEADAAARRSAWLYDTAAGAWERALSPLAEGPLAMETRRHLAEARYHAWEIGPNSRRALAAVEALTAFASRAPAGPERDQAARWLDQVRP